MSQQTTTTNNNNKQTNKTHIHTQVKDPMTAQTGLHIAVIERHNELLTYLFSKGSDVNQRDIHGRQPLHYACMSGNISILHILLQQSNVDLHSEVCLCLCFVFMYMYIFFDRE